MSETQPNPYAPGVVTQNTVESEIEKMRREHLAHEAAVKSVWVVFLAGAFVCGMAGTGFLMAATGSVAKQTLDAAIQLGFGTFLVIVSAGFLVAGIGIGRLASWSRTPSTILAGIGLLAFPIGTLINGYILYLLLSDKSDMVFSEEYRDIIRQTPHIKYATSPVSWGCLGLVLLVLCLGIVAAFFG